MPLITAKRGTKLDITLENRLIAAAQAGDLQARNALIEHHLPYIYSRIKKARLGREDYHCYLGIATTGFIRAIQGFVASKGFRLTTYASRAIQAAINRERFENHLIHTPEASKGNAKNWDENFERARKIGTIDKSDAFNIEDKQRPRDPIPSDKITAAMECLTESERDVLNLRMRSKITLKNIADSMGVSRERVRQIQEEGFIRMTEILKAAG